MKSDFSKADKLSMGMALLFCLLNGLTAGAYVLGRILSRAGMWASVTAALVGVTIVLTKGLFAIHPALEAQIMGWTTYPYVQRFYFLPALLFALGAVSRRTSARLSRSLLNLMTIALMAWHISLSSWMLLQPAGADALPDARHHLRQSEPYTCGPAACATALSYAGIPASEREMSKACLTTRAGTTELGIYRGLWKKGIPACIVEWPAEEYFREGQVAVVRVNGHHVVCVCGTGEGVVVHDPLMDNPGHWSAEEFQNHYAGVGVVIQFNRFQKM